jgi:hypothetical protein
MAAANSHKRRAYKRRASSDGDIFAPVKAAAELKIAIVTEVLVRAQEALHAATPGSAAQKAAFKLFAATREEKEVAEDTLDRMAAEKKAEAATTTEAWQAEYQSICTGPFFPNSPMLAAMEAAWRRWRRRRENEEEYLEARRQLVASGILLC